MRAAIMPNIRNKMNVLVMVCVQRQGSGDPTPCDGYPGPHCSTFLLFWRMKYMARIMSAYQLRNLEPFSVVPLFRRLLSFQQRERLRDVHFLQVQEYCDMN